MVGRVRSLCLAACLLFCVGFAEKKPQQKPPDIELVEVAVHRDAENITIDGKVRNIGDRPAKKLRVLIEFRSPEGKVISTGRTGVEGDDLEPGAEAEFHSQVPDEVRAVDVMFNFEDGGGRWLKPVNAGPHTIQ